MAQRFFFNSASAETQNEQDENLKLTVREAIAEYVKDTNEAILCKYLCFALQAVSKQKWDVLESKDITEKVGAIAKTVLSGTAWAIFFVSKNMARQFMIEEHYNKLQESEITFKQALAAILSSSIGQEDLHSFKYKLINRLFGLTARSDEEAKKIIQFSIEILKGNDQELEMGPTTTASSRRLSGSGE